ncbi:hypothetical protein ACJ5H2_22030 (plasmid) [Nocardioides sp. R1-1]|uniref:hypothetical protein n=1 Tax=Nocardioides sp. R1-1 TaxID=3383502 RepID=UPI0038D115EC
MAGGGYGRGAGVPLKDRVRVDQDAADSATAIAEAPEHPGRHCWVSVPVDASQPRPGLLDWKREGRRWEALVVWHDDAALRPVVKMDWLRTENLIPVPVDPNWTGLGD